MFGFDAGSFSAIVQVIFIDLVLAGDNAIVIGLAAAGLTPELRRKAIIIGILAATLMRIGFALVTTQLLAIVGLLLAGGLLLLWVCWKMFQELHQSRKVEAEAREALEDRDINADGTIAGSAPRKSLRQAVGQIIVADVSMSLDNVLAVAGAARHHTEALIFGLALSVVLMGFASAFIARLLEKQRWLAYVGLVIILFVAIRMIIEGSHQVLPEMSIAGIQLPWGVGSPGH